MINIKLLDEYINIFSEKDLLNLMKKIKIVHIQGFSSIEKAIKLNPLFVKNIIKQKLKEEKHSSFKNINDYIKLRNEDTVVYQKTIMIDLLNDYNTGTISDLLLEKGLKINNTLEKSSVDIANLQEQIHKLEDNNAELQKTIKQLNRENIKQEEILKKQLQDDYNKRLNEKILELEKQKKADILSLSRTALEFRKKFESLNNEYTQYKKIEEKRRYFDSIFEKKRIVLLSMIPKEDSYFPYYYYSLHCIDLLQGHFDNNVDEIWMPKGLLDEMKLNAIRSKVSETVNQCLYYEFEDVKIKAMGLERC